MKKVIPILCVFVLICIGITFYGCGDEDDYDYYEEEHIPDDKSDCLISPDATPEDCEKLSDKFSSCPQVDNRANWVPSSIKQGEAVSFNFHVEDEQCDLSGGKLLFFIENEDTGDVWSDRSCGNEQTKVMEKALNKIINNITCEADISINFFSKETSTWPIGNTRGCVEVEDSKGNFCRVPSIGVADLQVMK